MSPPAWTEPASYHFVVDRTCGDQPSLGRYRVTVANGEVTGTARIDGKTASGEEEIEVLSLGDLLDLAKTANEDGAEATISLDPVRRAPHGSPHHAGHRGVLRDLRVRPGLVGQAGAGLALRRHPRLDLSAVRGRPGRQVAAAVRGDQDVVLDADADAAQFLGHQVVLGLEVQAGSTVST